MSRYNPKKSFDGSHVNSNATPDKPFIEIVSIGGAAGLHLTNALGFSGPYILGIGKDLPGQGLELPNKANGSMIVGTQRATVTDPTSYYMQLTQSSLNAPLLRLEQNVDGAADALQLFAFGTPTATQKLLYLSDPSGQAGVIYAANGQMEWRRSIVVMDKDASNASYIDVTENNGVPVNTRTHTLLRKSGPEFYGYSGAAGQWWPFSLNVTGSHLKIQSGGLASVIGTPGTLSTLIDFTNGKMGFFGASAIAKPTGVTVDAAGIHAALVSLGLIAP